MLLDDVSVDIRAGELLAIMVCVPPVPLLSAAQCPLELLLGSLRRRFVHPESEGYRWH